VADPARFAHFTLTPFARAAATSIEASELLWQDTQTAPFQEKRHRPVAAPAGPARPRPVAMLRLRHQFWRGNCPSEAPAFLYAANNAGLPCLLVTSIKLGPKGILSVHVRTVRDQLSPTVSSGISA
jgi:hypothetical protein